MKEIKSKMTGEYIDEVPKGYKIITTGIIQKGDLIFCLGSNYYGTSRGWRPADKNDFGGGLKHLHGVCRKLTDKELLK